MPAEKTSATGYIVAAALTKLAKIPEWKKYFTEEIILLNETFVRCSKDSLVKYCIGLEPPRFAIWLMDLLFIPGLTQHYLFRKRFIEERVKRAIADGVRQVINLGAGFDTLAIRMAKEYPAVQFFEIDLPNTQTAKIKALESIHYAVPVNCKFIQADLAQTQLKAVLSSEKGFNPEIPACVIIEGVLMYLSESEVKVLFSDLHQLFQDTVTIIFGAIVASNKKSHRFARAIHSLLSRGNERYKFYCSSQAMEPFLTERGYTLKEYVKYKELQRRYRNESELTKVPEENENYYVAEKRVA